MGTWWGRSLSLGTRLTTPGAASYYAELEALAAYFGMPLRTILAGQMVYDASTSGALDIECGCTSASMLNKAGEVWHGRLLDWTWPKSIVGSVQHIRVVTKDGHDFWAEHIPGSTGFTGAHNSRFAANLNQAPGRGLRLLRLPALWWFRHNIENHNFRQVAGLARCPGGMTDALIHITQQNSMTARVFYHNGIPEVRAERLQCNKPVILANTYGDDDIEEDEDARAWSAEREESINRSRATNPMTRLKKAECENTVFAWEATLK